MVWGVEVIRGMVHQVTISVLMTVEWIPTGTCKLKMLELAILMVRLGMVPQAMAMGHPTMVWAMEVMEVMAEQIRAMAVPILAMVLPQLLPMVIQMRPVLVMEVVQRVDQEAHGALRVFLVMGIWDMVMLLGVLQVLLVDLLAEDLVNLQLERLDMEIKVMVMVVMLEMMVLMEINPVMALLDVPVVLLAVIHLLEVVLQETCSQVLGVT